MLTTLSILSRHQGRLFEHRASEDAFFTRFADPFAFARPKGPTALDVPQCHVTQLPKQASLIVRLLRRTRKTNP